MQLTRFLRSLPFLLGALLALAGSVPAVSAETAPADPNTVTIDFKGGPLSKLVAEINTGRETPINIINATPGFDPVVPPFVVRGQPFGSVMGAVNALIRAQGGGGFITGLSPNLAILQTNDDRKETGFVAFQLEMQLNRLSLEEIISAIQSAYTFAVPEEKPDALRFKFHPGTKMLFISGPQRNIDSIVRQVIQSLPFGPPIPPTTPPHQK
ncbi:MAG: hypothetical protein KA257_08725 [Opitutaceae bacterium]|nr:hypothetical protein [Opitutaceae bacterium]MBP9912035.1 hypothetical protein [Opitutaceae bacterium]